MRGQNRGGTHEVSVRLKPRAGECQSLLASWERLQVFLCASSRSLDRAVMRSGAEAGRRGGVRRASSRGAGEGTLMRTQSVFCCHGSPAAGEERYLSSRQSCHRYVPTQEPVSPVCHRRGFEYRVWLEGKFKFLGVMSCLYICTPVHFSFMTA